MRTTLHYGSVHTNALSFKYATRLGLFSSAHTIRWVFSSKTHRFEYALEKGSRRKRIHLVLVWTVEDGRKRIKMKTMAENLASECVCSKRIEFNLRHNVQFYSFWTFQCGQSKTHQNGNVDADRSTFLHDNENAFFWKPISVDRAYIFILKPVNLRSSISEMNNVMQRFSLTDHTTYLKTHNLVFL